jgi:hypothetical protein
MDQRCSSQEKELALTTTKLRAVVTMFIARLGASITDIERQILVVCKACFDG